MPTRFSRWLCLLAVSTFGTSIFADEPARPSAPPDGVVLPKPADVKSLAVNLPKVSIRGMDDAAQLVVTATLNDGRQQDLSGDVQYAVADGKTAKVLPNGRVLPLANGSSEVVAKFGDKSVRVPLSVTNTDENLPINFPNQVVPVFTKLGCNPAGVTARRAGKRLQTVPLGYDRTRFTS